jgi:hypothetical protein
MDLMSEEDLKQIRMYFELAKSFAPLADEALEVVFAYGPILRKLMDSIVDYQVFRTTLTIKQFEMLGMTREEAIMLTINNKVGLQEAIDQWKNTLCNTTKKTTEVT